MLVGVAALGIGAADIAGGSVEAGDAAALVDLAPATASLLASADMEMRYIQEDGPDSGHVRILLTPEIRPLTIFEARSAAQQAFLKALHAPGLGGELSRVTVIVRLAPPSHPDARAAEEVVQFQRKGRRDWSVLPGG